MFPFCLERRRRVENMRERRERKRERGRERGG